MAYFIKKDFANATLKECLDHPDIETLSNHIQAHPKSLETVFPEGYTPISYLLRETRPDHLIVWAKIQRILEVKKDLLFQVPPKLKSGWNVLMFASAIGNSVVVQKIIELDQDKKLVRALSKNGQTALTIAINRGHTQCVGFLIEADPKMLGLRTVDCHLDSVLEIAAKNKSSHAPEIKKLLSEKISEHKVKIPPKVPKRKVTKEEQLQNLEADLEVEKTEIEKTKASITRFMKKRSRVQKTKFQELERCEAENKRLLDELASLLAPEPEPSPVLDEGDETMENAAERESLRYTNSINRKFF